MPSRSTVGNDYRFGFNGQEKDNEIYGEGKSYTAEFWQYDARIGRRWNVDPLTWEFPWISPYATFGGNPIVFIDPDGQQIDTDIVNESTGATTHINDGKDQIIVLNSKNYSRVTSIGTTSYSNMSSEQQSDYNQLLETGTMVDLNSELGKTIRAVYAEMGNIGSTQEDRNVVAASIATRLDMGETIDEVLVPKQYNAVSKDVYKKGPYWRESQDAQNAPHYYNANKQKYDATRTGAISAAYKALNGLLPAEYGKIHSYVSPPLKSIHFDGNSRLTNVTDSFSGLKGVSGVWKIK